MLSKVLLLLLLSNLLVKNCLNSDVNTCQDPNTSCVSKAESQRLQRMFETQINNTVECIRYILQNELPFSIDPLKLKILPLYFNTDAFSSSMLLRRISLEGLTGFVLNKGTVDPIRRLAEIDLSFEQIKLLTDYNGNMEIMKVIKIFGKGGVNMNFRDLNISLKIKVKLQPPFLDKVQVKVSLPSTTADITGLFNDEYMSDIVSRQITNTFTLLAQEQENNFNELLNEWIQQLLDRQKKNLDFVHLFDIHKEGLSCDLGNESTLKFLNSSINGILSKMSDFDLQNYLYRLQ